jgi:regulator of protease activity HflC (stomatin/prohibitin superfamily)
MLAVLAVIILVISIVLFMQGGSLLVQDGKGRPAANVKRQIAWGGFGLALVLLAFSLIYVVNPGEVGVEVLFGTVQRFSENGMHIKNPLAEVLVFDVKTQRVQQHSDSASQDLQQVRIESVINYRLDAAKIAELYTRVGYDYLNKVVLPSIQEATKAATALYKVEDVIVKRHEVKQRIIETLKAKLENYYIVIEDVHIQDISFSPEFNRVVEEKQIEEQKIKTAEYRRQQAEQEKERTILEAQAEGEKQRLLRVNTSREVVDLKWIEKWDGKLPQTMLGGNSVPIVNVGR